MQIAQNVYGPKIMLLVLAFLSAFTAMTTDIYLPALPSMVETLDAGKSLVNMTLSLFFLAFSFGLLFWGPLSEKYGRKPILYTGLSIYILASLGCAFAQDVYGLIFCRILQAIGSASATSMATALVKDLYDGATRARTLATIMSIVIIAPIVAPVLGAQLLLFFDWRALFLFLSVFGIVGLALSFFITETVKEKSTLSIGRSLIRPLVLVKNPRVSLLLVLFSSVIVPLMAFLSSASFIYAEEFAMSEQKFSFFFAFNAICAVAGPILFIRTSKKYSTNAIVLTSFSAMILGALVILLLGHISPYLFALGMGFTTITILVLRAPGTNLILEQHDGDTGSLSSLVNFSGTIAGCLGMTLISIEGLDQISGIAGLALIVGIGGLVLWKWLLSRGKIIYKG